MNSSLIYSVTDKNITEVQLCLTKSALAELNQYCALLDSRRVRGLIHEEIQIGRLFHRDSTAILSKQDIKAQVMHLHSEALQDERNYRFYRNGLRIAPIDIAFKRYDIDYIEYQPQAHEELVIYCDRNRFECFFQFLKAFSQGFWGDVLKFSETHHLSTCIHDYSEADLPLLRESYY